MAELSNCHNAPVLLCEGNRVDVDPESIRDGQTYWYSCSECKEPCDVEDELHQYWVDEETPYIHEDKVRELLNNRQIPTIKVNRLEIIDHTETGRDYVKWTDASFEVNEDLQDSGKTLKIFLEEI